MFARQLLYLSVSECALCVDFVLLYIGTILYHVGDVLDEVVFHNVIRKTEGYTQLYSLYLFAIEVFVLPITDPDQKLPM